MRSVDRAGRDRVVKQLFSESFVRFCEVRAVAREFVTSKLGAPCAKSLDPGLRAHLTPIATFGRISGRTNRKDQPTSNTPLSRPITLPCTENRLHVITPLSKMRHFFGGRESVLRTDRNNAIALTVFPKSVWGAFFSR